MRKPTLIAALTTSLLSAQVAAQQYDDSRDLYGYPACNSQQIIDLVKTAIANGPAGRRGRAEVFTVDEVVRSGYKVPEQTEYGPRIVSPNQQPARYCDAFATTSTGPERIEYSYQWAGNSLLLRAKILAR